MVNYRRVYVEGGTYFFTLTLKNRQANYLTAHIDALRESFAYVKKQYPFVIIAIVILPEHLHCVWQLPEGDDKYTMCWRSIKSRFTHLLIKSPESRSHALRHGTQSVPVWVPTKTVGTRSGVNIIYGNRAIGSIPFGMKRTY